MECTAIIQRLSLIKRRNAQTSVQRTGVRKKEAEGKRRRRKKGGPAQVLGHLVVPSTDILPDSGLGAGYAAESESQPIQVLAAYALLLSA